MEPATSIERLGFKRWYERQLIEGHAWLVSCFLSALAIVAILEVTGFRLTSIGALVGMVFVYGAGLLCWHSLKRYRAIMSEAERLSEQSTCKTCRSYAAFSIIARHPLSVRCQKCAHEWTFR